MKVKELIDSKEKWTRHACYRDIKGQIIHNPEMAHSYCLVGAIMVCYPTNKDREPIFKKIKEQIGHFYPSHWNDSHKYEDVKQLVETIDI